MNRTQILEEALAFLVGDYDSLFNFYSGTCIDLPVTVNGKGYLITNLHFDLSDYEDEFDECGLLDKITERCIENTVRNALSDATILEC